MVTMLNTNHFDASRPNDISTDVSTESFYEDEVQLHDVDSAGDLNVVERRMVLVSSGFGMLTAAMILCGWILQPSLGRANLISIGNADLEPANTMIYPPFEERPLMLQGNLDRGFGDSTLLPAHSDAAAVDHRIRLSGNIAVEVSEELPNADADLAAIDQLVQDALRAVEREELIHQIRIISDEIITLEELGTASPELLRSRDAALLKATIALEAFDAEVASQ